MTRILKWNRKAILARNRVRIYRGVNMIMKSDEVAMVRSLRVPDIPKIDRTEKIKSLDELLRKWVHQFGIKRNALSALLKILKSVGFSSLPSDSRALMRTPRHVEIENRAGGKYWHNGIENCLTRTFGKLKSNLCIAINISVDGLPLYKSSGVVFWPILFNIDGTFTM